eukprot:gnl/TRDRNA2_/TRDRNA2_168726_c3_seq7.p1 gnl/TRDRNA2_/TRDRNA2_168726_c3~~gnl/TRDRNA2_/TRDRNA2_168726_c3_seq7.p1  ORF type:complete len:811 (-),score=125.00 gnl/TRDRNA2_/TRDRNA2_168726_c3_seq7:30-2462(-)
MAIRSSSSEPEGPPNPARGTLQSGSTMRHESIHSRRPRPTHAEAQDFLGHKTEARSKTRMQTQLKKETAFDFFLREATDKLGMPLDKRQTTFSAMAHGDGGHKLEKGKAVVDALRMTLAAGCDDEPEDPWIKTTKANLCLGVLIMFNCVYIGIETDWKPQGGGTPFRNADLVPWYIMECFFTFAFLLEFIMRLAADGLEYFCSGWNLFDFAIVQLSLFDTVLMTIYLELAAQGGSGGNLRVLSVLRILRLMRLVRVVRLFRFFRDLAVLLEALLDAMKGLIWASVFLLIVSYSCAIMMTILVGQKEFPPGDPLGEAATFRFGTVPTSMLTLFIVMTGESWPDIMLTTMEHSPFMWLFFVPFVMFSGIVIMNLVVGIICGRVMEYQKESALEAERIADQSAIESLAAIYLWVDADRSGHVQLEELESLLRDEEIRKELGDLNIFVGVDARLLMRMWDVNGNGSLTWDEFLEGALALRHCDIDAFLRFIQYDVQSYGDKMLSALENRLPPVHAALDDASGPAQNSALQQGGCDEGAKEAVRETGLNKAAERSGPLPAADLHNTIRSALKEQESSLVSSITTIMTAMLQEHAAIFQNVQKQLMQSPMPTSKSFQEEPQPQKPGKSQKPQPQKPAVPPTMGIRSPDVLSMSQEVSPADASKPRKPAVASQGGIGSPGVQSMSQGVPPADVTKPRKKKIREKHPAAATDKDVPTTMLTQRSVYVQDVPSTIQQESEHQQAVVVESPQNIVGGSQTDGRQGPTPRSVVQPIGRLPTAIPKLEAAKSLPVDDKASRKDENSSENMKTAKPHSRDNAR